MVLVSEAQANLPAPVQHLRLQLDRTTIYVDTHMSLTFDKHSIEIMTSVL